MEAIYPISALQRTQKKVKDAAKDDIVRITENGVGAYVFGSEKAFEERIQKERAQAAYEARLHDAIVKGRADIEDGRYSTNADKVFDKLQEEMQDQWK